MIQLAHEGGLASVCPVHVCYIDTGWAASFWAARVDAVEALSRRYGFEFHRIRRGETFEELMLRKKGFPMPGKTWCSYELKGKVFNEFSAEIDPSAEAIVCIGKRRDESPARKDTPEWIDHDEFHDTRTVWHMLAFVAEAERNQIILRSGMPILPHRSQECSPCANANRRDFKALTEREILRTAALEQATGKSMFRPYHHMGATGIRQVIEWAHSPRGKYEPEHDGCGSGYCE
ncbi:MAG: phosphoadenosine phosphosulfate reductase family protein [Rhizobiales bacterium]|nr:phosphoadenosine phosphosulfate reductase family protein [Hyphomicrobiales bacterium]